MSVNSSALMLRSVLGLLALTICWSALGDQKQSALEPVEKLGRALYRGDQVFTWPARISNAQVQLPGASAACANCHGLQGDGLKEAGVKAPSVRWQPLLTSTDSKPAYANELAVKNAIEHAQGRGVPLAAPMPRYQLTDQESTALLAYLRVIGTARDVTTGVSADTIVLGTVLPLTGSQAQVGFAIEQALQARVKQVNQQGGVFGRQIDLIVRDAGLSSQSALDAIKALSDQTFALVGMYLPEHAMAKELATSDLALPLVATLGIPVTTQGLKNQTYLMSSIEQQLKLVWFELGKHCDFKPGVLVLHKGAASINEMVRQSAAKAGFGLNADWGSVAFYKLDEPDQLVQLLNQKQYKHRVVIALTDHQSLAQIRTVLELKQPDRCLASLAIFSGNADRSSTAAQGLRAELVALPMQSVSFEADTKAVMGTQLWQLLADLSMRTCVEALSRTGHSLTPTNFETAMLSIKRFEPIAGVQINFSPQQRHGLAPSYFWKGDLHETSR